jgi:hypothetical protein
MPQQKISIEMAQIAVEVNRSIRSAKLGANFSRTPVGFHFHYGLITFMTNPTDSQRAMTPPNTPEVR